MACFRPIGFTTWAKLFARGRQCGANSAQRHGVAKLCKGRAHTHTHICACAVHLGRHAHIVKLCTNLHVLEIQTLHKQVCMRDTHSVYLKLEMVAFCNKSTVLSATRWALHWFAISGGGRLCSAVSCTEIQSRAHFSAQIQSVKFVTTQRPLS